jgi:hypothetical protein
MALEDDFVLGYLLAQERGGGNWEERYKPESPLTRAAILASERIVEMVEDFAVANGKTVLYVLSYSARSVGTKITDGSRFDQEFVDFMRLRQLPYVDLMEAHLVDYARFKMGVEDYLGRYYIGHYNPLGNSFQAFAIKDQLVEMLQPKPVPYLDL